MNGYELRGTEDVITPALIYYVDRIRENIKKALQIAGSGERLWPHVKSHKSEDMVRLQMEYGITKFKAATVAEAEMAARVGAEAVILAYPLVGPNIRRYAALAMAYPETNFYAIGDDLGALACLAGIVRGLGGQMEVLLDINMGMDRTGVRIEQAESLYRKAALLEGIRMAGLHCYDGHHNSRDLETRMDEVGRTDRQIEGIRKRLSADGLDCGLVVAGGTPSFPCHAALTDWYLSPGTAVLTDAGYYKNLPDLGFVPAAALLTRVVSHPAPGLFTLDLGYKGIAADPAAQRGYIIGLERAQPVLHSEEHWVFRSGEGEAVPEIGAELYVIPTHICPTSALYPEILTAEGGKITGRFPVTARNRKINY